jgi:hypothetical protein
VTSTIVLALATLGDATQIGLYLFFVVSPKVANASTVSCSCRSRCRQRYRLTFANVNTACLYNAKHYQTDQLITFKFRRIKIYSFSSGAPDSAKERVLRLLHLLRRFGEVFSICQCYKTFFVAFDGPAKIS